jgi:hypothetical protein
MPKLTELEAQFLRYEPDGDRKIMRPVLIKAEAHGVMFLCPKCFAANGGAVGTHRVICWSRSAGTPEDAAPGPGRWKMDGAGLADLTLNADPPSAARSVLLTSGCDWHGFVTDGVAE